MPFAESPHINSVKFNMFYFTLLYFADAIFITFLLRILNSNLGETETFFKLEDRLAEETQLFN